MGDAGGVLGGTAAAGARGGRSRAPAPRGNSLTGGADLALLATKLCSRLHEAGLTVGPERAGRFVSAVLLVEPLTLDELYWCAAATLTASHQDLAVFDAVFGAVFGGLGHLATQRGDPGAPGRRAIAPPAARDPAPATGAGGQHRGVGAMVGGREAHGADRATRQVHLLASRASDTERLAARDFASLDADELAALRLAGARLRAVLPVRISRRARRGSRGRHLDVRAMLRASRHTGGEPLRQVLRSRTERPRRLVMLLDISGSMAPYARAYLQLLQGASGLAGAEVFSFATRLTRLTRVLRDTTATEALARAGTTAPDWSGGTRIASSVAQLLDLHGRRGMVRGAVVVVVSDGWECGDAGALAEQMSRLSRLAHQVIWANPRRAAPGYEPAVAGMAAALPFCDAFVSGHSLDAVEELVALWEVGRR